MWLTLVQLISDSINVSEVYATSAPETTVKLK